MLDWLRGLFSASPSGEPGSVNVTARESTSVRIDQLFVEPDDGEDFDRDACERLIGRLVESGATTVDEVQGIAVSLEDFFDGNRCRYSIAANADPAAPYDRAESWYELLKQVRGTDGVDDVLVVITMIEPYEGGRVGMWPYSDSLRIHTSLDRDAVAAVVAPLEPDEVREMESKDASRAAKPFHIWWD